MACADKSIAVCLAALYNIGFEAQVLRALYWVS